MPQIVSLPVTVITLKTESGCNVCVPLFCPQSVWINESDYIMSGRLAEDIQKHLLDKGNYSDLAYSYMPSDVALATFEAEVVPPKNNKMFNKYKHKLHLAYWQIADDCLIGMIPELGINISAETFEKLIEKAISGAQLEFIRKGRLNRVHNMVEVGWFANAKVLTENQDFRLHSPAELEKLNQSGTESTLKDMATHFACSETETVMLDDILKTVAEQLEGRYPRSVLLIGGNGSGKTAVISDYVRKRNRKKLTKVWETTASMMLQGLTGSTGWQKALVLACRELRDSQELLYVNHLIELFEVGQYCGNTVSIGEAMREHISRGEIILIAEATDDEVALLDKRVPGFINLFSHIRLVDMPEKKMAGLVKKAVKSMAERLKIKLETKAIEELLRLQKRFNPYSGFPGKTIRFVEAMMLKLTNPENECPVDHITMSDMYRSFSEESGVPEVLINPEVQLDQEAMQQFFKSRIFGQEQSIEIVTDMILSFKAAMVKPNRPIASFLFVGPTGVGKTEMAKTLAEYTFSNKSSLLRFDMSEYSDPLAAVRLTGDLGNSGSSLVTKIRQNPFAVVLFDEIEKAHYSFFDLLLQILDEGRLTGGDGQLANFCSCIIVMTSNIGAEENHRESIGFAKAGRTGEEVTNHFRHAVEKYFRPELFNRLDKIVPFHALGMNEQRPIIQREIELMCRSEGVVNRELDISIDDSAYEYLARTAYDPRYGARHMQRSLRQELVNPLAQELNRYPAKEMIKLTIYADESAGVVIDSVGGHQKKRDDNSLLALEEQVAMQRRLVCRIEQGTCYFNVLSEYDRYEQELRRSERDFWEDEARAQRYLNIKKRLTQFEIQKSEIIGYETALMKRLTGMASDVAGVPSKYAEWKRAFFDIKRRLHDAVYHNEHCTLALFSHDRILDRWTRFYTELFRALNIEFKQHLIILKAEKYEVLELPLPKENTQKNLTRVGMRFDLKSLNSKMLIAGEHGFVRYFPEPNQRNDLLIDVSDKLGDEYEPPQGVHRRTYFTNCQPSRTVREGKIRFAKSEDEYAFEQVQKYAEMVLQDFELRLNSALEGEANE